MIILKQSKLACTYIVIKIVYTVNKIVYIILIYLILFYSTLFESVEKKLVARGLEPKVVSVYLPLWVWLLDFNQFFRKMFSFTSSVGVWPSDKLYLLELLKVAWCGDGPFNLGISVLRGESDIY